MKRQPTQPTRDRPSRPATDPADPGPPMLVNHTRGIRGTRDIGRYTVRATDFHTNPPKYLYVVLRYIEVPERLRRW